MDSERAVIYGSMITSAVPATGTLKRQVMRTTPLQRACSFAKQVHSSRQEAKSSRKIPNTYQTKITRLTGRRVR